MEEDGVKNVWAKTLSHATCLPNFFHCHIMFFFHSRSRSWVFLEMIASDSHSQIVGMDFYHSLPVPEFWESIFSFPSHSRIWYLTDGNQNGNWITVRDTRPPIFQLPLHFLKQLY